jgi:hypothetical protein
MNPWRSLVTGFTLIALGSLAIARVQPKLAQTAKHVRLEADTSALPPPAQLEAMSLGYRAAAADILWATLLVEHGIHTHEKRAFRGVERYLDGIIALYPDHPMLYQFIDTILIFRPGEVATPEDARTVRRYLAKGSELNPHRADVWMHYGEFLAFLAPSFLKDEDEIQRWRTDGAYAMAKAVDLGASPDRTLAVSTLLTRAGANKAAIAQLQRAYALADDADTRDQIVQKLERLQASTSVEASVARVEHEWRTHVPHVSRSMALLLGPFRDAAACAGKSTHEHKACRADWSHVTDEP